MAGFPVESGSGSGSGGGGGGTSDVEDLNDLDDVSTGSNSARGDKGVKFNTAGTSLTAVDLVEDLNDLSDVATGTNTARSNDVLRFNSDGTSLGVADYVGKLEDLNDVNTLDGGVAGVRANKGVRFNADGTELEAADFPARTRTELINGNVTIANANTWVLASSTAIASTPAGLLEVQWDHGNNMGRLVGFFSTEAWFALPVSAVGGTFDRDNAFEIVARGTNVRNLYIGRTSSNTMLVAAQDAGDDPSPLVVHRIASSAYTNDLNALSDVDTGSDSARASMGVRFNSDGTSLEAAAWPSGGGASDLNDLSDVATGTNTARGGRGLIFNAAGTSLGTTRLVDELNELADVATGADSTRAGMGVRFNADGSSLEAESWPTSGQGSGSGNNEFQALGEVVEYEDWALSGNAIVLHASTSNRGIPFTNDATHIELELDFTDATTTSGTIAVEYSQDRGTNWHNFLDEDGDDVAITAGSTTAWTQRVTREFASEADSTWSIQETHTLWFRLSGTGLGGTIDWQYQQEDDSKTTRSYAETLFETDTTLPARTYSSNGSGNTVTQVAITPVPYDKILDIIIVFKQGNGQPEHLMRLSRAELDRIGSYDAGSEPTTFNTDPLKAALVSAPVAYTDEGPYLFPPVSWIHSSRGGPHNTTKHRQVVGFARDGAYLTKALFCVFQQPRTLKEIAVVRER